MKCKRRYMHGKRRRMYQLHQDVDTTFVDKVYTKTKVDEELEKSGHYSEGSARGKKKSGEHYVGKDVGGGSKKTFLGELNY